MLPDESVAVQVTIVSPSGNVSGASLVIIGESSIMSFTDDSPSSTVIPILLYISSSRSSGTVKTGEVVSTTVIV